MQGWQVEVGRVERIWRREGLIVPQKQPKRGIHIPARSEKHGSDICRSIARF